MKNRMYVHYEGGGYRAPLGLEYRIHDQEKGKKHLYGDMLSFESK